MEKHELIEKMKHGEGQDRRVHRMFKSLHQTIRNLKFSDGELDVLSKHIDAKWSDYHAKMAKQRARKAEEH